MILPINQILVGNNLDKMRELPDRSIHCAITSPSYFGLRDYKTEPLIWGGNPGCRHEWGRGKTAKNINQHLKDWTDKNGRGCSGSCDINDYNFDLGNFCVKCHAWKGSFGLEPTPELYVAHFVEIARELKRILRDDGTFWLNIGDSYASGKSTCFNPGGGVNSLGNKRKEHGAHPLDRGNKSTLLRSGLKPKDLIGIPWMLAFALRADGWYLRSDIIWYKRNPMPESVTDRPTKSHEYIFLLTKSENYYYDAEAIKEPMAEYERARRLREKEQGLKRAPLILARDGQTGIADQSQTGAVRNLDRLHELAENGFRNKRTVWDVTTKPFRGCHFATFPADLVRPMILAGTSAKGVCAQCGAPWVRVLNKTGGRDHHDDMMIDAGVVGQVLGSGGNKRGRKSNPLNDTQTCRTLGWKPTCKCNAEIVPAVVLDFFAGAGTTAVECRKLHRNYIGIELNGKYVRDIAEPRIKNTVVNEEMFV